MVVVAAAVAQFVGVVAGQKGENVLIMLHGVGDSHRNFAKVQY